MNIWFIRSNVDTLHNNPNTPNYVEGEPPKFPNTIYNYREKCLNEGFARIGWPNTGDLQNNFSGRLAPEGYSFLSIEMIHKNYLNDFQSIKAGDFILIPADDGESIVHLGIVLTKNKEKIIPYIEPRPDAYFYYFNLENQDWYECAHRVNVQWAKNDLNEFSTHHIKSLKFNIWRKAFGKLNNNDTIFNLAKKFCLY